MIENSNVALAKRCCMDKARGEFRLFPARLRSNFESADGVRASRVQHTVEDGYADGRLCLLARKASRSQTRTKDGLVSAHQGGYSPWRWTP